MSKSLNGVEDNIRKVEKLLFDLLTDSLKDLVGDQQFKISRSYLRIFCLFEKFYIYWFVPF